MSTTEYQVKLADVTKEPSDLLLLKHAQAFYGADKVVASALISAGICKEPELHLEPGHYAVFETKGVIAPARVMFLGTPQLYSFTYEEMQRFARRAVEVIAQERIPAVVMTTTVHGTGYGLDGGESLQRLVRGFEAGLAAAPSAGLGKVIFATLGEREVRTLSAILDAMNAAPITLTVTRRSAPDAVPGAGRPPQADDSEAEKPRRVVVVEEPATAPAPPNKKRVFVAMPYADEFENVYEFGIYPAVRNCGFICEKVDETHFTGDILNRITRGIETASIVIADLTGARPNVYLEVGYAWGHRIPVIFLARRGEPLHFDVSTHKCIYYGKFTELAKNLEKLLRGLETPVET
jgi:hypothetical protein